AREKTPRRERIDRQLLGATLESDRRGKGRLPRRAAIRRFVDAAVLAPERRDRKRWDRREVVRIAATAEVERVGIPRIDDERGREKRRQAIGLVGPRRA